MNSELMNIENIDPIIVQYLIDKMIAKIEKRRNSQRDRGNRWYEKHRKVHKDTINEKKKQYYRANEELFKTPINCECGKSYTRQNKSSHTKSKFHIEFKERGEVLNM